MKNGMTKEDMLIEMKKLLDGIHDSATASIEMGMVGDLQPIELLMAIATEYYKEWLMIVNMDESELAGLPPIPDIIEETMEDQQYDELLYSDKIGFKIGDDIITMPNPTKKTFKE